MITYLSLLVVPFMAWAENPDEASQANPGVTSHPTPAADAALPDGSLYALDSEWRDQSDQKIVWKNSGGGHARVLAMGYTACKGVCPRIIADMRRIEDALSEEERKNVTFTFLSFTPETDKAEQLAAFAKNHKLEQSWQVMTSDGEGVLEMAVALGIQYTKLANEVDYAHSYLIAILAPDGRIVHKWLSPDEKPEVAVAKLRQYLVKK